MPVISPLAIAGAAPRMTTKRIAPSSSWNSTMASGNQAIDGIVWMPVIIEPIARRTIFELDTARPMATPMTIDAAKPTIARWNVIPTARRTSPLSVMSHSELADGARPGKCVLRLPAAPHDALPDEHEDRHGGELRPGRVEHRPGGEPSRTT